jgi:molybdenum cofactor guanylyltransferase
MKVISHSRPNDSAGFVLAGGRSSRMGRDKALVALGGRPLIAHALETLRGAGLPASIAGAQASLESFAPVIPDADPDRGPLAGVCSALAVTQAQHAVFLSIDMPLVPPSLVAFLLHYAHVTGHAVTLASAAGFDQTFPAVLDRAAVPHLRAELDAGQTGCFRAFSAAAAQLGQPVSRIPVEYLAQSGQAAHPAGLPAAFWLMNLNHPADLERAEALGKICSEARHRVSWR